MLRMRGRRRVERRAPFLPGVGVGDRPADPVGGAGARGAPEQPPAECRRVEGYQILGTLGRGGMGVVDKTRQVGLDWIVALKMILAGARAGPTELTRFRLGGGSSRPATTSQHRSRLASVRPWLRPGWPCRSSIPTIFCYSSWRVRAKGARFTVSS